ncbi:MAG: hypothetical protein ACK4QP_17785 [Pseudorhizobium sp.]
MINRIQSQNWRRIYLIFAAVVLLAPAVAMPFSSGVSWGPGDFLAAGLLLASAWLAVEVVVRVVPHGLGRIALAAGVGIAALAIWAHLAVQF